MQLAGNQFHQGGFAFAVSTDDADTLVRFDRQIDVFEQEGTADAEVDALQLDKRHLPIVAAGLAKAVSTVGWDPDNLPHRAAMACFAKAGLSQGLAKGKALVIY